ncbi:TetR/AcrR family transcriptional regulator [Cnuibacter physcomitrellae]|uniref:TetR/AcrR family transcriptional regulator n=1 Tax=Cnuibacter physcomitrellae TaxID=1619308 RepID=UPI002175C972|nr:TetR/AcrR family transcriptional regulator [Cnuibacter physcomitrellae]MCS5497904.1 TetR/AcrR family transcriptional regulator [Cnuibacter physcomitrellae]
MTTMSPSRSPRRRMQPAERVAQIAATAEEVALSEGLAAITVRSVAGRMGVAPSLVAHYVPSMDELVTATFDRVARREISAMSALLERAATPLEQLRLLVGVVAAPDREDVPLWSDAWSLARRNTSLAAAARDCLDAWQGVASSIVAAGRASGAFPSGDPEHVGLVLFALIDATNAYSRVAYRTDAERSALIRTAVASALGLAPGAL